MANICNNDITINGEAFEVDLIMEKIKKDYDIYYLDRPDEIPTKFHIMSKWTPPLEYFSMLSKDFPNIEITIDYYELGCAFYGQAKIKDGYVDDWSENMDEEKHKEYSDHLNNINS